MTLAGIEQISDDCFKLTGVLTLLALKELDLLFAEKVSIKDGVTLDLSAIKRVDSAGLVLLLHWMRMFKAKGLSIHFLNPTEQMLSIAELSDINNILFGGAR